MDSGNPKDDYKYYVGYEDEPEIILHFDNIKTLHLWDGYFCDIFNNPQLNGKGWKGFTRDYHQLEGIFSTEGNLVEIDPEEYLEDLTQYSEKHFAFEETKEVFDLLVALFKEAIARKSAVSVERK